MGFTIDLRNSLGRKVILNGWPISNVTLDPNRLARFLERRAIVRQIAILFDSFAIDNRDDIGSNSLQFPELSSRLPLIIESPPNGIINTCCSMLSMRKNC